MRHVVFADKRAARASFSGMLPGHLHDERTALIPGMFAPLLAPFHCLHLLSFLSPFMMDVVVSAFVTVSEDMLTMMCLFPDRPFRHYGSRHQDALINEDSEPLEDSQSEPTPDPRARRSYSTLG